MKRLTLALLVGLMVAPFASAGEMTDDLAEMRKLLQEQQARLDAQDREIASLRANQGDTWLNERRSEEIKTLVREVLSDAETRASLMDSQVGAGFNGEHFYIGDEAGNFLLNFSGQVQVRYAFNGTGTAVTATEADDLDFDGNNVTYDNRDNVIDDSKGGFEVPRAKLRFDGHVVNPRLTYAVQFNFLKSQSDNLLMDDNNGGGPATRVFYSPLPDVGRGYNNGRGGLSFLEDAWIGYDITDQWDVKVGQFKGPFLREESVDSSALISVERSLLNDLMTVDYTQGVQLRWVGQIMGENIRFATMLHDGSYQANTAWDEDTTEVALTTRGEWLVEGTWNQFDDMQAWSDSGFGLLVGAAVDVELGERGQNSRTFIFQDDVDPALYMANHDVVKWTVDVSLEAPEYAGLSVFAAVVGQHLSDHDSNLLVSGADQFGFVAQGSFFIVPDKLDFFGRWEYLDMGDLVYVPTSSHGPIDYKAIPPWKSEISVVTFGANYYFAKNAAKASIDLQYVLDPLPFNASSQNLRADAGEDQMAVRAQVQLLF